MKKVSRVTDRSDLLQWAYLSGLLAGVLVLAGSLAMGMMSAAWTMGQGFMMGYGPGWWGAQWLLPMTIWGAIVGGAILYAASKLAAAPRPAGIALVALGILSFPAMGGFMIGALAAIVAGVLALGAETRASPRAGGG